MFKIQLYNSIAEKGLKQFPSNCYELGTNITEPDAILLRSHQLIEEQIPESVKIVGRAGAGVNNVPVNSLTKRGIPVLNTPGANANAVRELVLGGMLLASRNILPAWQSLNHCDFKHESLSKLIENNKKQFSGYELKGKTLGVIGLGNIGVKVANAAVALGMHVIGYDPEISVQRAWELSAEVRNVTSLNDVLEACDFVSVHVPLVKQTTNLINENNVQYFKSSAVLLNFAREGIVNIDAIVNALSTQQLAKYVTDFPTEELLKQANAICLPHLGASTAEAEENCAMMVVKQVRDFLETGSITNAVNFPSLTLSARFKTIRLAIVNANVPNMVAQISSILARADINIVSLQNNSLNDIAYTVIDLSHKINEDILQEISHIGGVLHVRVLYPLEC